MNRGAFGGKSGEIDSSPGVESLHQGASEGSEFPCDERRSRGRGRSRKNRIIFNAAQLNALERLFQDVPYPDMELRMKIAERLDIDEGRVTVWFQNRRAKFRRVSGKSAGEGSIPEKSPQVNSPASVSTQDQYTGESALYNAPHAEQNFVHTVPVSGVEFSTWVNHSHAGDQSTVVHQSRDAHGLRVQDNQQRYVIPQAEVSSQRRTLAWLQTQRSPQAVSPYSPYSIANSSPQTPPVNDSYSFGNHQAELSNRVGDHVSPTHRNYVPRNQHTINGPNPHDPPVTLSRSNSLDRPPHLSYNDYVPIHQRNMQDANPSAMPQNNLPNNEQTQRSISSSNERDIGTSSGLHYGKMLPPNNHMNGIQNRIPHCMDDYQRKAHHNFTHEKHQNNTPTGGHGLRGPVPPTPPSQNGPHNLPPNKDVKELQENHLGEALMRLAASQGHHLPQAPLSSNPNEPPTFRAPPCQPMNGFQENLQRIPQPYQGLPKSYDTDAHSLPNDPHRDRGQRTRWNEPYEHTDMVHKIPEKSLKNSSQNATSYNNSSAPYAPQQQPSSLRGHHLNNSVDINVNQKRKVQHSSSDSDNRKPREAKQRRKKLRKRRKIRREQPARAELPLSELSNTRRLDSFNGNDSDDAMTGRQRHLWNNGNARSTRRRHSSCDDAAVSSESERRWSSSTVFSSTSDSDFESPYCKQAKAHKFKQPKSFSRSCITDRQRRTENPKPFHEHSTPLLHSNASLSKVKPIPVSKDARSRDIVKVGDIEASTESNNNKDIARKSDGRPNQDDSNEKPQVTDSESASLINFFFGPKTPDIPQDNDESDEEPKSTREAKSKNEDIISESLHLAKMCGSPSSPGHIEQVGYHHYLPRSRSSNLPFGQMREPGNSVGHVMAYHRDMFHTAQRQYTIHYGNGGNAAIETDQQQAKPRGIIRPVPQRVVVTGQSSVRQGLQKNTPSQKAGADHSAGSRPTGTVRPWCDDLPKATVNPEQDISQPVREPVPMDGAPPNKVCTMVKDALSPVDLLAKYLTWTGTCYVNQFKQNTFNGHV